MTAPTTSVHTVQRATQPSDQPISRAVTRGRGPKTNQPIRIIAGDTMCRSLSHT